MEQQIPDEQDSRNDQSPLPSDFIHKSLGNLPERAREVLIKRFDLDGKDKRTLQEIGEMFKITRERIRQIEKGSMRKIKESNVEEIAKLSEIFKKLLIQNGGVAEHDFFLEKAVKHFNGKTSGEVSMPVPQQDMAAGETKNSDHSASSKQSIVLILCLCDGISRNLADKKFKDLFSVNSESLKLAESAIEESLKIFAKENRPMDLAEIYTKATREGVLAGKNITEDVFHSYLRISNEIASNPFAQWGLKKWPLIFPKSIRDKSYLVVLQQKEPLHFKKIAELVDKTWDRKRKFVLPETVHNELIKDKRFVLVGRGIYALAEWGYERGTVRDIIKDVLSKANRPLSREEIVKEVSLQRMVKPGTIVLNLKDKDYFEKTKEGTYKLKK